MLIAVAEIVLEVIALIFQRVERFIFDAPPRSRPLHDAVHGALVDAQVGDPTSVAERLTQERDNVSSSTQTAQTSCYPKRARRCAMDSIQLWARDGEAVRQAIELGEIAHIETASEELTDEFLLFAIESGLLQTWANAFPDPRREPEIGMEVILPAHLAARFAGLYSMRKAGYVLRSARVLGALGYSVEVIAPEHGLSVRGTSDDKLFSGDVVRKLLVQMEEQVDL